MPHLRPLEARVGDRLHYVHGPRRHIFHRELPGLSEELSQAGLHVYEALAISEVLYLAEQHADAGVVVDHTVENGAAHEVAPYHPQADQ